MPPHADGPLRRADTHYAARRDGWRSVASNELTRVNTPITSRVEGESVGQTAPSTVPAAAGRLNAAPPVSAQHNLHGKPSRLPRDRTLSRPADGIPRRPVPAKTLHRPATGRTPLAETRAKVRRGPRPAGWRASRVENRRGLRQPLGGDLEGGGWQRPARHAHSAPSGPSKPTIGNTAGR